MTARRSRSNIKADRRNPYRDARARSERRKNEQRKITLKVKRLKPRRVRTTPIICVKPISKTKLTKNQLRKVKHVHGTGSPSHPAYTHSPKMFGLNSSVCSNSDCKCRGKMVGAHVSIRTSRKIRQYAIVPTCPSCNSRGEPFQARRNTPVFILGKVRTMHRSKPYNENEDTIIKKRLFVNGSRIDRLEREVMELDDEEDLDDSFADEYFDSVK